MGPSISGRYPAKFAAISESTAASNEIVAGVASKSIRVISVVLVCAAAVTVTWEDEDGTNVSGAMSFPDNGGYSLENDAGLFQTIPGKGLHLLSGGAVQVSGHISYIEVD